MTQFVLAAVLGLLFATGTFLVLRRDVVRVVWGVTIITQSANVYLVTMGGLEGTAPIIEGHGGGDVLMTDPLVQALVLTAIVIGFGTTAFALVLTYRVYEEHGTIDVVAVGSRDRGGGGERGAPASDGGVPGGDGGVPGGDDGDRASTDRGGGGEGRSDAERGGEGDG